MSLKGGWSALRRFGRREQLSQEERCELCAAKLHSRHEHLIDPSTRALRCACGPCALLFPSASGSRWKRVTRKVQPLDDFALDDAEWSRLRFPIQLAFIYVSGVDGRPVAVFPGPGGPTEAPLDKETWQNLVAQNPALDGIETDVEALLVNRIDGARDHFRLCIDECYRLIGLLRMSWRGFSGGPDARAALRTFFDELRVEVTHA